MLCRWKLKYLASNEKGIQGTGNPKVVEAERIRQLERELRLVTEEQEILKKTCAGVRERKSMIYSFISDHKNTIAVRTMYRVLGISVSNYYAWTQRQDSNRKQEFH